MHRGTQLFWLALFASSVAFADPPLGSRLGSDHLADTRTYSEADGAHQGRRMAACMLRKNARYAHVLLETTDDAVAKKALNMLLREDVCAYLGDASSASDSIQFQFPNDVLRGFIAEELLISRLSGAAQLPNLPVEKAYVRSWFALSDRDAVINEMAVCLSESDPADTVTLLRSTPYTSQEMDAVHLLAPAMSKCLRQGYSLHANRQALRAAIAEGLYHRVMDTPVVSAGTVVAPVGKR